ncbi:hypothetical protein BJ741DRAFT_290741 [Chytriomyces cf. hyalinus JEL632]|nr:hypothetical protein BJ741DRAFT_290741 [Chytriomyces cf. hyalinus JEL632]
MSTLLDTCRTLTIALSSANADARFNSIPDQCNQAVMNAVINLSNSCQSSEAFPFALSNALPARAGLGSPNYSNPTTMQAFCQATYGIALSVDGSVIAPPVTTAATTTGPLTTSSTATSSTATSSTATSSRTLTSTAAQSQPAATGGSGGGFMFPSSTGNSFAFPTSVAGGSQNSNNGGSGAAQGMSGGAIAGIIVGVLVLLGLVGGLVYWFRPKKDTSDKERLDVGPLPPTSQFSSSNPAYHTPKMEPPSMAAYHYQQQSQQQPLPTSARSDHLMYNMPANSAYTPSAATSDTLQDQQAPPIPSKQTPTNVFDTALNSAYTSYAQTSGVPVRSPATYDAAIASVAPKSLQTTNPEDWSVEQCAYWAREIPEFGTAVSWQILSKWFSLVKGG